MQPVDLTIITVNKNNKDGLKKTIQSVLSQSFVNFEYIIVDGASTDGSVEVISRYLEKEQKISTNWISEQDGGVYEAMNKGIKMARGIYLLFLNSGDYLIDKNVIGRVFTTEHVADILFARCRVSNKGQVIWTSNIMPETITLGTLYWTGIMHQSTFIKRSLITKLGMYDESFKWLADIQFWYTSLILHDATTEAIDIITSDYNTDGISSTSQKNSQFIYEREWPSRQPILKHVMPDYAIMKKDKEIAEKYNWIENHKMLQKILKHFKKIVEK